MVGPAWKQMPAAVTQALKWAILSTYTDSPTLLVCVLPTPAATASCQKFLAHPRLLPLAQMQGLNLCGQASTMMLRSQPEGLGVMRPL